MLPASCPMATPAAYVPFLHALTRALRDEDSAKITHAVGQLEMHLQSVQAPWPVSRLNRLSQALEDCLVLKHMLGMTPALQLAQLPWEKLGLAQDPNVLYESLKRGIEENHVAVVSALLGHLSKVGALNQGPYRMDEQVEFAIRQKQYDVAAVLLPVAELSNISDLLVLLVKDQDRNRIHPTSSVLLQQVLNRSTEKGACDKAIQGAAQWMNWTKLEMLWPHRNPDFDSENLVKFALSDGQVEWYHRFQGKASPTAQQAVTACCAKNPELARQLWHRLSANERMQAWVQLAGEQKFAALDHVSDLVPLSWRQALIEWAVLAHVDVPRALSCQRLNQMHDLPAHNGPKRPRPRS